MKRFAALLGLVASFPAVGCGLDDREAIVVTGSSTMAPLLTEIGRRFEQTHPHFRVDVHSGGSSRGISDVAIGLADIGMSSRALTAEEQGSRRSTILARDGIAFIVHRDNPVIGLALGDIKSIYTGDVDHWRAFGGADERITVINRADGRSELQLLAAKLGVLPSAMRADLVAGETKEAIRLVAISPTAITYVSLGIARFEIDEGVPIRLLRLDGVEATTENVRNEAYRLQRPLLLVTRDHPSPRARRFVEFATSKEVFDLVEKYGFIPVE